MQRSDVSLSIGWGGVCKFATVGKSCRSGQVEDIGEIDNSPQGLVSCQWSMVIL